MAENEREEKGEAILKILKRLEADVRAGKLKGLGYVEVHEDRRLSVGMVGYASQYPELAMGGIARLGYLANQLLDEDERCGRKTQD